MAGPDSVAGADWLKLPAVQAVFAALDGPSGRTRAVGGIVRDTLLGRAGSEVDMATEFTPDEVIARAEAAGFGVHPTGLAHGTVTLVHRGKPVEVTTLRRDIETDGRHAVVHFGTDWQADAERRDFTLNAIYAFMDGRLHDPLGGIADCLAHRVRFIGDPDQRIAEDYLRVLRFFRFFAIYGDGRPDADGLKACARARDKLQELSAERVWSEIKKLLGAPDPSRALLWMRTSGVLAAVLPESEKWGIDAIHGLVDAGRALDWPPDAMVRLMAIIPPRTERITALADRLKLSNAERGRLFSWASTETPDPAIDDAECARQLYRGDEIAIADRLRLALAAARAAQNSAEAKRFARLLSIADTYERPQFPVRGEDLIADGMDPGPRVGRRLRELEDRWIASGFKLSRRDLMGSAETTD